MIIRIASTLGPALLFVVSGCSSNAGSPTALPLTSSVQDAAQAPMATVQSPSVNPQAPNALDRLAPADEYYIPLRFKNITPNSTLHFLAYDFFCTSAEPKRIDLTDGQTATVVITASAKNGCEDRDRFVYFGIDFRGEKKSFNDDMPVYSTPPNYDWRLELNRGAREHGLCTIPDGFEHGRQVHNDELIEFYLCG